MALVIGKVEETTIAVMFIGNCEIYLYKYLKAKVL